MPLSNDLPTIYTVARHAGVSVATVSRVLRGSPHTSDEARERVQAAVAAVGYSPLRRTRGRPVTHGVVVPNLAERAWTEFLLGLQSPAGSDARDDVRVARMVLACDEMGGPGDVDDAVEALADRTNGLVICQATASDELVARLASEQPVVLVGRGQLPGCDLLDLDQRSPIAELVAGLCQLGLRRMLFVGDKAAGQAIGGRQAALRSALAHLGAEEALPPLPVATDESGADEALPSLLAAIDKVDVAVCASDELALRLLHVLVWRRVRVPQDLAVVGWGGSAAADYVVPRLTTVRDRSRELGELAAARLRARLAGDDAGDQPQTLRGEVVWRESTGRPG